MKATSFKKLLAVALSIAITVTFMPTVMWGSADKVYAAEGDVVLEISNDISVLYGDDWMDSYGIKSVSESSGTITLNSKTFKTDGDNVVKKGDDITEWFVKGSNFKNPVVPVKFIATSINDEKTVLSFDILKNTTKVLKPKEVKEAAEKIGVDIDTRYIDAGADQSGGSVGVNESTPNENYGEYKATSYACVHYIDLSGLRNIKLKGQARHDAAGEVLDSMCEAIGRQPEASNDIIGAAKDGIIAISKTDINGKAIGLGRLFKSLCEAIGRQPEKAGALKDAAKVISEDIMIASSDAIAMGIGKVGASAMEAISRQPEAEEDICFAAKGINSRILASSHADRATAMGQIGGSAAEAIGRQPEAYKVIKTSAFGIADSINYKSCEAALGIGTMGAKAMEAMGRQPQMANNIYASAMAFIENCDDVVIPKGKVTKIKVGKRKATITFEGNKEASYYQVMYKVGNKKWKAVDTTSTTLVVKKIKKGTRVKVKVRSQFKSGNNAITGAWSKTKTSKRVK